MNRRKHPRMPLAGMMADISDGKKFFTGTVHDISRFGLSLDEISTKIDPQAKHLTIIVDGQGGHFRLKITPRWETVAGRQKLIGGQIEQSPFSWTEFVQRFETDKDDILGSA
jgi:hypothetical protein